MIQILVRFRERVVYKGNGWEDWSRNQRSRLEEGDLRSKRLRVLSVLGIKKDEDGEK